MDYDANENVEENGSDYLGLEGAEDMDAEAYAMNLGFRIEVTRDERRCCIIKFW